MQPNVVFNPLLHLNRPDVEWLEYNPNPPVEKTGRVSAVLQKYGLESWESYAQKQKRPIHVRKLGRGNFGYCFLVEGEGGLKVVFKVAFEKGNIVTNIDDREIKIGKQMSVMCLGSLRQRVPSASPFMIRVFGSVKTNFVTPLFWANAITSSTFDGEQTSQHNCMFLEYVPNYTFSLVNEKKRFNAAPKSVAELMNIFNHYPQSVCNHGFLRFILFQVMATISVFGRRFRHNDISTSNVMITPSEGKRWAFQFKVDRRKSIYFRIPSFPFELKIHDFGYTVDLNHGEELDREFLKSVYKCGTEAAIEQEKTKITNWRKKLGLESIPSLYYDPYLFLWWVYSTMGKTTRSISGECEETAEFMSRLGLEHFPGKDGRLSSDMQNEAERENGLLSKEGFQLYSAIEILQDEYFREYRITKKTFDSLPANQKITVAYRYDENVPEVDISACRPLMAPSRPNPQCGKTLLGTEIRTDLCVPLTTSYSVL